MRFNKKNLLFLIILVAVVGVFAGLIIREHLTCPENQFGIEESDSFCLTHLLNVNGVVGAEKTEFTTKEKRKIMDFLANLKYKEPLPPRTETIYGVPVQIKISKQDGNKIVFLLFTNIEEIEYDKDGNILNQNIYTTAEKGRSNIYKILGINQD